MFCNLSTVLTRKREEELLSGQGLLLLNRRKAMLIMEGSTASSKQGLLSTVYCTVDKSKIGIYASVIFKYPTNVYLFFTYIHFLGH